MHPIGPELPISAHVACARVCRQLYVLRASHALVQATVGVGTVMIVYIGVAYTREGGGVQVPRWRLYMAVDPKSMCGRGRGPCERLLHTPGTGTQKNV